MFKFVPSVVAALAAAALLSSNAEAIDKYERYGERWSQSRETMPVANANYAEECGTCHMAYPPGFLPERSWRVLFEKLDDHFGENAELDDELRTELLAYTVSSAAERTNFKYSALILDELWDNETPARISQTPFIATLHAQIPRKVVAADPKIGSLSQCDSCHTRAKEGSFRKREIRGIWGNEPARKNDLSAAAGQRTPANP